MNKVTTDADADPKTIELYKILSACAEGQDANAVLNAAQNLIVHTIEMIGKKRGWPLSRALELARDVADNIVGDVSDDWDRQPQPGDVPVFMKGH